MRVARTAAGADDPGPWGPARRFTMRPPAPAAKPPAIGEQALLEVTPQTKQFRQMLEHLRITADRQLFHRVPGIEALRLHLGPADSDEGDIRQTYLQGLQEMRTELVAGGLAGDDANADRHRRSVLPGHPAPRSRRTVRRRRRIIE